MDEQNAQAIAAASVAAEATPAGAGAPGEAHGDDRTDAVPGAVGDRAPEDGRRERPVDAAGPSGATASQLRRFVKSRPWVPMHELRRRFGIEGSDDEMNPIDLKDGRIFIGLPPREAALVGDLIRQGEVGYELVHDPDCPAVAGVYPMRPVVRT